MSINNISRKDLAQSQSDDVEIKNNISKDANFCGYNFLPLNRSNKVEWRIEKGLIPYLDALSFMEKRVDQINKQQAQELAWLVEHPPLYTAGTSAHTEDLLSPERLPVYKTGRGGQFTYHGPGQRVIYLMLDLKRRKQDIRAFITAVEELGIQSLKEFGITAERRENRVGIWVSKYNNPKLRLYNNEEKIAAIGLRLRKWVSFHGIAINIAPNLAYYEGIVPCGIKEYGVTSMANLGKTVSISEFDDVLKHKFKKIFGKTETIT